MSKQFEIKIPVTQYNSIDELPDALKNLAILAIDAKETAYAPYSNFKVGAAVLLQNGAIITGNNQENAAYPSGLCAERVAMFYANAQYPNTPVVAIAVCGANSGGILPNPVSPCGSCRQVLIETEQRFKSPIKVLLIGANKINLIQNSTFLLPLSFSSEQLNTNK